MDDPTQKPQLHFLEDFKNLLKDYEASDHARSVLAGTPFVALTGIAGGGRSTLISYLVEHAAYEFVVSDTTRPPKFRDGKLEQHGVHYHFRREEQFLADLRMGEFIEAEIIHNQQVSGTSIRAVQEAAKRGHIPIRDFEFGGIANLKVIKPDTIVIGLLPPSFEDWQYRLKNREIMTGHEFKNRMETAIKVLEAMLDRDYIKFVISGDLNDSSKHVRQIVEDGVYAAHDHVKGIELTKDILSKTKHLLKEL